MERCVRWKFFRILHQINPNHFFSSFFSFSFNNTNHLLFYLKPDFVLDWIYKSTTKPYIYHSLLLLYSCKINTKETSFFWLLAQNIMYIHTPSKPALQIKYIDYDEDDTTKSNKKDIIILVTITVWPSIFLKTFSCWAALQAYSE